MEDTGRGGACLLVLHRAEVLGASWRQACAWAHAHGRGATLSWGASRHGLVSAPARVCLSLRAEGRLTFPSWVTGRERASRAGLCFRGQSRDGGWQKVFVP